MLKPCLKSVLKRKMIPGHRKRENAQNSSASQPLRPTQLRFTTTQFQHTIYRRTQQTTALRNPDVATAPPSAKTNLQNGPQHHKTDIIQSHPDAAVPMHKSKSPCKTPQHYTIIDPEKSPAPLNSTAHACDPFDAPLNM